MQTDILIIGAGPAGLQAAIHIARRKIPVTVTGKIGNSALAKAHVENLAGLEGKRGGMELLESGSRQAISFGAQLHPHDIVHIGKAEEGFTAKAEDGNEFSAKAVILAIGVKRATLKLPEMDEYVGKGLSYCADCDARFFRNRKVVVVGGESAASSGALILKKYAHEVVIIAEKLSVSARTAEELRAADIKIIEGRKVVNIFGAGKVEGVRTDDGSEIRVDGVFIELGSKSAVEIATLLDVIPNEKGYIPVDRSMATSIPGVFACGDITGPPLQFAKALGEGCTAGISAAEYVKSLVGKNEAGTVKDAWEKSVDRHV